MTDVHHEEGKSAAIVSHESGRSPDGLSGQFGVSDKRRAELAKMEQDAGQSQDAGMGKDSSPGNSQESKIETNPISAESVGNETEPENTDRNQY